MPPPILTVATPVLLALICVLAFAVRLFPVVRWGSVIHEYDPHFNYRVTRLLHAHGSLALRDWFDDRAWYPLGRSVGETVFPGLMLAAIAIQWVSGTLLRLPIDTRVACVFVAPVFASFACLAIYGLTKQVTAKRPPALVAAALFSICPAYISRSTAGSFDNEGVAIFLLILTFWLWIRSVQRGRMVDACATSLAYFAMVVSWGGYVFIINLIPLHVLVLVVCGKYSPRVYIAYSTFYPLATLMAMQVPFVGFNAITKAESAASHGVFVALQGYALIQWLQATLSTTQFTKMIQWALASGALVVSLAVVAAMASGKLQWSGRSLTLLDPTYASKYIPIIASVGEHQPPSWANFYLSLGPMVLLAPLGLYYCMDKLNDGYLFMVLYATFSFYFAGIMVRLLLTLAPAACFLSAIGLSECMTKLSHLIHSQWQEQQQPSNIEGHVDASTATTVASRLPTTEPVSAATLALQRQRLAQQEQAAKDSFWIDLWRVYCTRLTFSSTKKRTTTTKASDDGEDDDHHQSKTVPANELSSVLWLVLVAVSLLLVVHFRHCVKVTGLAFSSTSMVHESSHGGVRRVHDDYREAYAWLRANAEPDANILSWWDYGYQLSALANRTVLVDNNTWNNTHIATVGRVLVSSEEQAYPLLQSLDVDYILILFGGRIGMSGDDLDKLPWILKITQDVFPQEVIESEFQVNGRFVYDTQNATSAMQSSLLYKMSYYRFLNKPLAKDEGEDQQEGVLDKTRGGGNGKVLINAKEIQWKHLEEAYTSDAWIVRIYRVKRPTHEALQDR